MRTPNLASGSFPIRYQWQKRKVWHFGNTGGHGDNQADAEAIFQKANPHVIVIPALPPEPTSPTSGLDAAFLAIYAAAKLRPS